MKPSIAEILRRIRPLPPIKKVQRLSAHIEIEPLRSVRRRELEIELQRIVTKQLEREDRQDRLAARLAS